MYVDIFSIFHVSSIRLLRMSPSLSQIGGIVWPVFWCNVICWIIVYLCICNGVKSVGKVSFPILSDWYFLARCRFVNHKINIILFLNSSLNRCVFLLADCVLHGDVSLLGAHRVVYSWRHITWRLEGHNVLYPPGLGAIEEAESTYLYEYLTKFNNEVKVIHLSPKLF